MSSVKLNQNTNYPDNFPAPWAAAWGEDESGLWMTLILKDKDIQQTFRWIEPGEFIMGSSKSEHDRGDNETRHKVLLTQGYWLADTACTQALWKFVRGSNSASFKNDLNNPVERVSWEKVQGFMVKLNQLVPSLAACLPTEAQWEYACRAGTQTAFSFGGNITTEQVNYNGNYPYKDGKKGQYREQTVAVGSLLPNLWGLYEMHGNVWEWCRDWYADYSSGTVTDPVGPVSGSYRVLRGGSWFNRCRSARSAYRRRIQPVERDSSVGFRLALGSTSSHPAGWLSKIKQE